MLCRYSDIYGVLYVWLIVIIFICIALMTTRWLEQVVWQVLYPMASALYGRAGTCNKYNTIWLHWSTLHWICPDQKAIASKQFIMCSVERVKYSILNKWRTWFNCIFVPCSSLRVLTTTLLVGGIVFIWKQWPEVRDVGSHLIRHLKQALSVK
jgi:hypothetical protein